MDADVSVHKAMALEVTTANIRDAAWKRRKSRIFGRDEYDHYVEESWCAERLFDEEFFPQPVFDPFCGWGRILKSARGHNLVAFGSDIVDRGAGENVVDFLNEDRTFFQSAHSIVSNPPFDKFEICARKALSLPAEKVAMIWLTRRLNAARWLKETPLARILFMTPRPSMPSGEHIANGGKVGGGTQDFCWLIWIRGAVPPPTFDWLVRDREAA
jgi:hypothetical protein